MLCYIYIFIILCRTQKTIHRAILYLLAIWARTSMRKNWGACSACMNVSHIFPMYASYNSYVLFHNFLSCRQPGFKQMKILRQERHTVCFIEFEVSNCHSTAFLLWWLNLRLTSLYLHHSVYTKNRCYTLLVQDVNSATNVHHNLQGAVIPSSGSVGMRIQYPLICLFRHLMLLFFLYGFIIHET